MDINIKCPVWGRNFLIILIGIGILIWLIPCLESGTQQTEVNLVEPPTEEILKKGLVIVQGNSLLPISDPFSPEPQIIQKISVIVTGYSSSPWETDGNPYITAAGTWVREGIVANNLLPFGTKVRLPEIYGETVFVVEDRMNWKKGYYHVDIWFPSYWEAKNFGAKRTYIEILES